MSDLYAKFSDPADFVVIAGPCVIESEEHALRMAKKLCSAVRDAGFTYVFKSSYDKANRTSVDSFRGPGLEKGLRILERVRREFDVPVISDIHDPSQAAPAAEVLDIVQIPAFLCRQTDLLVAAGKTGRIIAIKKGQFVAPADMTNAVNKVRSTGNSRILLTERGASFGYNNLVVDMRSIPMMQALGCPVVFDATHSVQIPGGMGTKSGGKREFVPTLAKAAVAAGADAVFLEVHDNPEEALCDGPNMLPVEDVAGLCATLREIKRLVRK